MTGEILIVDDERTLRDGLKALFSGEGLAVRTAKNGEEAVARFAEKRPDLVLLDVMMPKMNGFRTCEELRKLDGRVPIIFLAANNSEADQVRGIGLGADDFVAKAADTSVLMARIRRALERAEASRDDAAGGARETIRVGRVTVNVRTLKVLEGGKETAQLTRTEAGILQLLASGRERYFTKDELISSLRGEGFACEDTMLYVHMHNLRKKLGAAAAMIGQSRGCGYRLSGG